MKNCSCYYLSLEWCVKDKPRYSEGDIWTEDRVFGMQFLNGVNPMMIQRCEKLPTGFPVTQDLVAGFLDRGLTLEEEMKVSFVLEKVEFAPNFVLCK